MELAVNDVVEVLSHTEPSQSHTETHLQRLLWLDKQNDVVVLMNMEFRSGKKRGSKPQFVLTRPSQDSYQEFVGKLESGALRLTHFAVPAYMLKSEDALSEDERNFRDAKWSLIEPLVSVKNEPHIYDPATRGPMVLKVARANRKIRKAIQSLRAMEGAKRRGE